MGDKCEKYVFFRTVEQRTPNVFGVLSIMPCATAVDDFLGVLCATFGIDSCSTKCSAMWTRNFFRVLTFTPRAVFIPATIFFTY